MMKTVIDKFHLSKDQALPFLCFAAQLSAQLQGELPPPLEAILTAEPRTGKTHVIKAISEFFMLNQAKATLVKAAYIGSAAMNMEGETIHHVFKWDHHHTSHHHDCWKEDMDSYIWSSLIALAIDEWSTISVTLFHRMVQTIQERRAYTPTMHESE
jgi:hypothetical protein